MGAMAGKSLVALRCGSDRCADLRDVLRDIDSQMAWHQYQRIVIKPNFVSITNPLAATHVEAVRTLLSHIRSRFSGEIWLIEGGAGHNRLQGFINYGYDRLIAEFDVVLKEIGESETVSLEVLDKKLRPIKVKVDKRMTEGAFIISITPPKTHDTVMFTASLKNVLMGSLVIDNINFQRKGRRVLRKSKRLLRSLWDRCWPSLINNTPASIRKTKFFNDLDFFLLRNFNDGDSRMMMHQSFPVMNLNLFLLARHIRPHLSVIDGFEVMAGDGPIDGEAVRLGFALAGKDCISVDATAARIMGIDPMTVGYLNYSARGGLGNIEEKNIEITGNAKIASIGRPVKLHTTHPQQSKWRTDKIDSLFHLLMESINHQLS